MFVIWGHMFVMFGGMFVTFGGIDSQIRFVTEFGGLQTNGTTKCHGADLLDPRVFVRCLLFLPVGGTKRIVSFPQPT